MARLLLSLLVISTLVKSSAVSAAEGRFEVGDGPLAVQAADGSEWKVLRVTDAVPARCRLKTSPVGVVRVALPDWTLFIGADSEVDLDIDARRIIVRHGRTRLVSSDASTDEWRCESGETVVSCRPGSELALAADDKLPALHLVRGKVRVQRGQDEPHESSAPPPEREGFEAWAEQIRSATEPRPMQGLGQLVTKDAQSGSDVRLGVQRYHVNVVLKPPVALVQIDQSFFNPYPTQQEGTFVFNLPSGASVSRFAMYVTPASLIEGELIERKRADQVYTSIVRTRRDPAILEQIGDNLFRMRVFPIFARDTKRILLDYTVPLVADQGEYRFQLPLMSDLKPIRDFSISGTVHPPFAQNSISSPTHPGLEFKVNANGTATFQLNQKEVKPPPYLALNYVAPPKPEPMAHVYRAPSDNDQFFVATIPETMNPAKLVKDDRPCDLLLLVETSGNARLAAARRIARTAIAGLRPEDRLQIGCVDVAYRPLTTGWCRGDSPEARDAMRRLYEQFPLGVNDLKTSLPQARAVFADAPENRRPLIVYVGEGPSELPILNDANQVPDDKPAGPPFFAMSTTAHPFLESLATRTGGRLFDWNGVETSRSVFEWSLARFPSPTIVTAVKIGEVSQDDLFYDKVWPAGHDLHLYGKRWPRDTLQITLTAGGVEKTFNVDSRNSSEEDVFTGRSWARLKLNSILQNTLLDPTVRDQTAVQFCQEWSLMSPLTAFLVLETEQDYERWKIDRKVRRRYWKPAGAEMARIEMPLPTALPGRIEPRQRNDLEKQTAERVRKQAQRLLARKQPEQAMQLLKNFRMQSGLGVLPELRELEQQIKAQMVFKDRLVELGLRRPLADRKVTELFPAPAPLLTQFAYGGMTPEFLKRHPHADRLLQTIDDLPAEVNIEEFAKLIRRKTGVPVVIDIQSLEDEGIGLPDVILGLEGLNGVSVRALLKDALGEHGMGYVSERHFLKITTLTAAETMMIPYVYPVADLLPEGPLPAPNQLANPYFDADQAARRRIETRLKQVISIKAMDNPLEAVVKAICDQVGLRPRTDLQSLQNEGIDFSEATSTIELLDVPASVALDEVLKPHRLVSIIVNETLKVTTASKADEIMKARAYSVIGLGDHSEPTNPFAGMMGMMGMGGFGGGFGGAVGGSGGGFGGAAGMGGMGGMMGGGGSVGFVEPNLPANSGTLIEPFDISPANPDAPPDEESVVDDGTFMVNPWTQWWGSDSSVQNMLQQSTTGNWMVIDQEGGAIQYFDPSQTLLIRQNQRVHDEIADILDQQRQLISPQVAMNRQRRPASKNNNSTEFLHQLLYDLTGKWMIIDQEGGSIADSVSHSLTILQDFATHEEIENILTQLRRSRIVAATASSRTSWDGIDDLSAIDTPSLTPLPRNSVMIRSEKTADEAQWLASRKPSGTLNQLWRSTAQSAGRTTEFGLRQQGTRLEFTLPDRTLRIEGLQAVVVYPGLALGEINDWSEAARLLVDAALPWLPHRSNEELASVFDISRVSEDADQITLRMGFPGLVDSYVKATFSKQTGQPVKWVAVVADQSQYELRFDRRQITAVDPDGVELERWELISNDAAGPIPALNEGWQSITLVTIGDTNSPYVLARQALRKAETATAKALLTKSLGEQPQQPLLHLLLAWCEEFAGKRDPASLQTRRVALERVLGSSAQDLVRLISPRNFPILGELGVFKLLMTIPENERSAEIWGAMAQQAHALGRSDDAILFVQKALDLEKRPAERTESRVLQVELLLSRHQLQQARAIAEQLTDLTDQQLAVLAHLFAGAEDLDAADRYYDQLRERSPASGLALARMLEIQADLHPRGRRRWELLAAAQVNVPNFDLGNSRYLGQIIAEAESPADGTILGELAATVKNEKLRTYLKMYEADLITDKQRSADIVLELGLARRIPQDKFFWALRVLERAERSADLIRLVEDRLLRGERLELGDDLLLREAYLKVGRAVDARRAGTQQFLKATPPSQPKTIPAPVRGGGFFSIK